MEETKLPAGLMNSEIEFFSYKGEPYYTRNGQVVEFKDWGVDVLTRIRIEMESDPRIEIAFLRLGINNPMDQIRMFILCRFCGDFDKTADISFDGIMVSEYAECCEKACVGRNIICQFPEALNGDLTSREMDVVKMIVQDLPDKIIADKLVMSIHTLAIHRKHIEQKVGCHTKVGIACFAKDHNIC